MLRLTLTCLLVKNIILFVSSQNFEMTIFHTSNIRGQFVERTNTEGPKFGGVARISHLLKAARADSSATVLYLDAGGVYTGSIWFTVHRDKIVTELMNELKPTAMCLGNHEFDFGISGLLPFLQKATFPVVVSNFDFNDELAFKSVINESLMLTFNKKKIGIVGYLDQDVKAIYDVGNLEILNPIDAIKKVTSRLVNAGIDTIIALGHASPETHRKIAVSVEDIDLIVAAHPRLLLTSTRGKNIDSFLHFDTIKRKNGRKVPIVRAYGNTTHLGKTELIFNELGKVVSIKEHPIFLDENVPQDEKMLKLIEKFRPAINELNTTVLGQSKVLLDASPCRTKECNIGNLITDSFVYYRASRQDTLDWTDSSIAIINAGSIRESIDAPLRDYNVYKSDILSAIPYQQLLYIVEMEGIDLIESLKIGTNRSDENIGGGFLIFSGLRALYLTTKPNVYEVNAVQVRCAACKTPEYSPIQTDRVYKIITIQFLVQGGDGHVVIKNKAKSVVPLGVMDVDALEEYLVHQNVVITEIDGRITIIPTGNANVESIGIQNVLFFLFVLTIAAYL